MMQLYERLTIPGRTPRLLRGWRLYGWLLILGLLPAPGRAQVGIAPPAETSPSLLEALPARTLELRVADSLLHP